MQLPFLGHFGVIMYKQEDIQGIASTAIRVDKKEIKMQPEDVTFEGEFIY